MTNITVEIQRLGHAADLDLPDYATPGAAGMDLYAAVEDSLTLVPDGRALIPTGISIALPEGYEGQIRSRSGIALRNCVIVLNAPGTIDSDFRGEIEVLLMNQSHASYDIIRGQRIAQLIVAPVARVQWHSVTALPGSARGAGGFGSTGS